MRLVHPPVQERRFEAPQYAQENIKPLWDPSPCPAETCSRRLYVPLPDGTAFLQMGQAFEAAAVAIGRWLRPPPISPAQLLTPKGGVQELARLTQWTKGGQGIAGQNANMAETAKLLKDLPQRINAIRAGGVTKQMAQQWAQFYRQIAASNPATAAAGNPNALPRAILMQAIADLL